jgi:hypothetical protein
MPKIIDQELVLLSLVKVVWDQAQKTELEQYRRPVRPTMPHDQQDLADVLLAFRKHWSTEIALKKQTGGTTNFEECKQKFFNDLKKKGNWSQQTRNLYSSAISIYMNWDRSERKISKETHKGLTQVVNFLRFLKNNKNL